MKKHLVILSVLSLVTLANAKDLGVQGNIWPIVEKDIREMMVEQAARTDWKPVQDQLKKSAETFTDRLPKRQMGSPDKTETNWIDPSIELTSDIQAPVKQPDGSIVWQVLAAKGTKVNPLHQMRPVTAFFLFDAADEDQLKLAKALFAREPDRIVPVESGRGNIKESSDVLERAVFHASDAMLSKFQVRGLPTLIYPGTGNRSDYIGVTTYARPYNVNEVLLTWSEIGIKAGPKAPASGAQQ